METEATKKYQLALDLKNDPEMITQYEFHHRKDQIWPEILAGIKQVGILNMTIYRTGNRLFMILETVSGFDLKRDFERMADLPRQKEWASLMNTFQQKLPFSNTDDHWVLMDQVFNLNTGE